MTFTAAVIGALLVLGVIVEVLSVAGLVLMRTSLQRLHFVGPATIVGPVLVGLAIALGTHATPSQGAKGLLIAAVLAIFSGVISHETGCAALARENDAA